MKKIILFAFALVVLAGCKTIEYVPVVETKTDTVYQVREQRDSIWLHDSVYFHEYTKGDTVFRDRDRWHTKYIETLRVDTFRELIFDSIPQPYPVTQYVKKQLTWWQKTRMHTGEAAMLMLLASLGYVLILRRK